MRRSRSHLYREAIRATLLGLFVNLVFGVTKLTAGIIGGSFALVADAVNSLGDTLVSIVVLAALKVAQKPPDDEHPYGHTRAEGVAASNVALLIMLSAILVGWEALRRMSMQHGVPPAWTLWIAAANVGVKEWLYRYKVRIGRRTGSMAVVANAWDHRSDALCSLAVLIGLAVVRAGGPQYVWADEVAALVVATLIVLSGMRLFRQSASELMDLQAGDDLIQNVRSEARSVDGVREIEKLWVRKSGLEYLVDIHIQVNAELTVEEGHRIGHRVKDHLLEQFPSLRDILVHLEPFPHTHTSHAERE